MVKTAEEIVPASGDGGNKGLKPGAIGLVSTIVIGVASTAPGYSLAASLGYVADSTGVQAVAVMLFAFVPMYFIASAYRSFNKVDPDCGTTFTWATRTFGPKVGWLGGWGIIVADLVVMPSLAGITGSYFFQLFGADGLAASKFWPTVVGVIFIMLMTWMPRHHLVDLQRCCAHQGLQRSIPGFGETVAELAQPISDRQPQRMGERVYRGHFVGHLHVLGLGHRCRRQ